MEIEKDEDQKNEESNKVMQMNVSTTIDKVIPKFCTNINIGILKNNNLVLTLVYNESENFNSAVIDRVVIDIEHAKSLNLILSKIIEDYNNDSEK